MFYIIFGLLYPLSLLPLKVLYRLSDLAYFILYYIVGYRKKIVFQNLTIAFPKKSEEEKKTIAKKFYRNFTDTFIETIKFLSASPAFFKRHYTGNVEIFQPLYKEGRKCEVLLAHNFNWELANLAMPLLTPYQLLTVYMPIENKAIDRLFKYMRTRTGSALLPAPSMSRAILPYRSKQYILALVADQNPGNRHNAFWVNFFGRPTPFVKGPEKGARANDTAVVFCYFTKKRRGYYNAHFELATTEPKALPEGELTKTYVSYLEKVISAQPEMWLWSHRRWKHEWREEYGPIIH